MNTLLESPKILKSKRKTLRFTFITSSVSGVAYYRMCNFAWAMRSWPGIETHVWPYSSQVTVQNPWQVDMLKNEAIIPVKSLNSVLTIRQYLDYLCESSDVIVWQPLDFPHSFEIWQDLRMRHQKPFLMEIDDFCGDVPIGNEAFDQFRPGSRRYQIIMEQMRNSDGLVVSTPYLAKQYKGYNENIYVMPNSMDLNEWDCDKKKGKSDRIRIGWIGGGTHGPDLEMVQPVIEEITKAYKNVWFYCIHGVPNCYKKMPKVYWTHKWATINLYPRFLSSFKFDIGIAPLIDNNFNRGKSNLRWLEYSAQKIPTVASPLPDFTRVIKNGSNGYIANSIQDWKDSLKELIEDETKRVCVGHNAYETIKQDFNVRKTATQYMRLLKEVARGVFPPNTI